MNLKQIAVLLGIAAKEIRDGFQGPKLWFQGACRDNKLMLSVGNDAYKEVDGALYGRHDQISINCYKGSPQITVPAEELTFQNGSHYALSESEAPVRTIGECLPSGGMKAIIGNDKLNDIKEIKTPPYTISCEDPLYRPDTIRSFWQKVPEGQIDTAEEGISLKILRNPESTDHAWTFNRVAGRAMLNGMEMIRRRDILEPQEEGTPLIPGRRVELKQQPESVTTTHKSVSNKTLPAHRETVQKRGLGRR
jgi:hypothetical protein